jgi:hypothetical protein
VACHSRGPVSNAVSTVPPNASPWVFATVA